MRFRIVVILLSVLTFCYSQQKDASFYVQEALNAETYVLKSTNYNKAANIFWRNGEYYKAAKYFNKVLDINKKSGNKNALRILHANLGLIYSETGEIDNSVNSFLKSIEINKELGDKLNVASGYYNIGTVLQTTNKTNEAIAYYKEALNIYLELNKEAKLRNTYLQLANLYEDLGSTGEQKKFLDLYSALDKKANKERVERVTQEANKKVKKVKSEKKIVETKLSKTSEELNIVKDSLTYAEAIKKKMQLEKQVLDMELEKKEMQLKNTYLMLIGAGIFILIIALSAIIIYRQYRSNKEKSKLLALQNKNITDSINYAKNIQKAILNYTHSVLDKYNSFVYFNPKDIVSGDFYWAFNKTIENKNYTWIAAVDCTGHGVPGAFMSMIGNSLLNEILSEKKIYDTGKILTELNKLIYSALQQDLTSNKDGMDVCLCRFEEDKGRIKCQFSGAKRQLIICNNNGLTTIHGDRKSIGGGKEEIINFDSKDVNINSNDMLYLTSDGIFDQHNEDRKKFGSKNVNSLFSQIHSLQLEEQKKIISQKIIEHKGNQSQRDDITIIGVKI